MAARKEIDFDRENDEILAKLDILAEYKAMGVAFRSERANPNGVVECFAVDRDERNPSAGISLTTGRYFDMGSGEGCSLWEFAIKHGGFNGDWRAARKHFAEKTGITFGTSSGGKASKADATNDERLDSVRWFDWNTGRDTIATIWGKTRKKGVTLEAIKLAGGRFGEFPIRRNKETKEVTGGEFKVIGIPGYDAESLNLARPTCWVIWNATGDGLPRYRGPDVEPEILKMRSVGSTRGTLMNLQALEFIASGGVPELIIKSGGPTDMLAILSAIPPEWRRRILVTTNASGETGEVTSYQSALFGVPTITLGDRDYAGSVGAVKWLSALHGERRSIVLPYRLQRKHGRDARDFLNGVRE